MTVLLIYLENYGIDIGSYAHYARNDTETMLNLENEERRSSETVWRTKPTISGF